MYEIYELDRDDKGFPESLIPVKNNKVKKIYYKGTLPDPKKKTVSIVGARNASNYGLTLARTIARVLANNDVNIVSGLALGIDTSAHLGALDAGKPTFAVLGSGVDICFPSVNKNVYDEILDKGGGIISEFPIGTKPEAYNFPMRNRIISGFADVVIVVEARGRSGSLITADFALEQGKSVFACPGKVGDSLSRGTNNLIKEGAYILTDVDDVLSHLGLVFDKILPKKTFDETKLDSSEKHILKTIGADTLHIDEISLKSDYPINKCLNILMSLELSGFIECTETNCYRHTQN